MKCVDCGEHTYTTYSKFGSVSLCDKCYKQRCLDELLKKSENIRSCSDFESWSGKDLSELFWHHIGTYIKTPNLNSLSMMEMAYRWACHDNHGLANSFSHAMKWAKINLNAERRRLEEIGSSDKHED